MANSMTIEQVIREHNDDELLQYLQEIQTNETNKTNNEKVMQRCTYSNMYVSDVVCTALVLALKLNKSMEVILKLIDIGGRELVIVKTPYFGTALNVACRNSNVTLDVISKLIEVGGRELLLMDYENGTALHDACGSYDNVSLDIVSKLIEVGGRELVMMSCNHGTALHYVCGNPGVSLNIVSKFIEVGGQELVMMSNFYGETALHYACRNSNMSLDIVSKLVEVGGRELLMMSGNKTNKTVLHYACRNKNMTLDIVSKLIEVGRKELVMMKCYYGETALHDACRNENKPLDIVSKLIEVGGRELVMVICSCLGKTALHNACESIIASLDIVSKLIEVGGRELVMISCIYGRSSLHYACRNRTMSQDIVSKLIDVGGRELLMHKNKNGDIALHYGYFLIAWPIYGETFALLLKKYILANIGGEFGIGGLFHVARQEIQNEIYKEWEELSPAVTSTMESLQEHQPPILHAAITAKAPIHVICDIIKRLEYSVLSTDHCGRYPIEVAFQNRLGWSEGLQQIVEASAIATAATQHRHPRIINSAAQYGLKWRHHMKELAEVNGEEIMNGHDCSTGLRLFMLAARGDNHDLSSIYGMMKMSPETNNTL